MNRLQAAELELLRAFIHVCQELHLQYYLVCGSALGAVKYGGFIPWDDDVDVALRREDYRVFLEKAQAYLPSCYFLQTYDTDPAYPNCFAKIRDSRTTFIEKSLRRRKMNHGIYIDVFPLDGYPTEQSEIKRLERLKRRYLRRLGSANAYEKGQKLTTKMYFFVLKALGFPLRTASTVRRLDALLSAYPTEGSALWCNHGNWQGVKEYALREQYGEGCIARFEDLTVTVPEDYDAYLTQKYGDWRADLPESEKAGHHHTAVYDPDRPYTDYFRDKKHR